MSDSFFFIYRYWQSVPCPNDKGKRATSLLPIVRTILGKIDLFCMGHETTIEARGVRNSDWLHLCHLPTSVVKTDKVLLSKEWEVA